MNSAISFFLGPIFIVAILWCLLVTPRNKLFLERPDQIPRQYGGSKEQIIKGLKFSSNNGLDALKSEYSSRHAKLSSNGAWGGNPRGKYLTYLEIRLPDFYRISNIITAGREGMEEWVTEFALEYWDKYLESWQKYEKIFKANTDDSSHVVNNLDLETDRLRIFPLDWSGYPSMRVGLVGVPQEFSKCKFYSLKIRNGDPNQQEHYQQLYDTECPGVTQSRYQSLQSKLVKLEESNRDLSAKLKASLEDYRQLKEELETNYCPRTQLYELAQKFKNTIGQKKSPNYKL